MLSWRSLSLLPLLLTLISPSGSTYALPPEPYFATPVFPPHMLSVFFNPPSYHSSHYSFSPLKTGAIQSCVIHSQSCHYNIFPSVPFFMVFNSKRLLNFIISPSFLVFLPPFMPYFDTFSLNYFFFLTFPKWNWN